LFLAAFLLDFTVILFFLLLFPLELDPFSVIGVFLLESAVVVVLTATFDASKVLCFLLIKTRQEEA
jgi:hypothetical protein